MESAKKDRCFLLTGEDTWSKNKWLSEKKTAVLPLGNEMMNYAEFKDKDILVSKLTELAETLPFFSEQKMIVMKESGFFKSGKKEESEKFEAFLEGLPDYLVLIIDEKEIDKRSKLYKLVNTRYSVLNFDYPGEETVLGLLNGIIKNRNLSVETSVLRYFLNNMPEDIAYIMKEFEKLADYAGEKAVTRQAVDSVCIFSLEKRIFELVKRIAKRNAAEAFQIYHTLIEGKESPIGILVLIARQYRMMLQVKYLLKNNVSQKDIASKMKLPYFALKDIVEQVNLYTFKQIEEILAVCLEADKDIKSGKMEGIKRVEFLIMECLR